jgi:hypothetical protein
VITLCTKTCCKSRLCEKIGNILPFHLVVQVHFVGDLECRTELEETKTMSLETRVLFIDMEIAMYKLYT